ncbi:TetR/AcrR family transcriptional regulator [Saccharopolyspora gloriosae]|uniref:AcrR family transcriptional regulator n=1 Tax=Saccharopolyspora gloriosae TaxID=455344 RepID=A0A840NIV4_9PSEU|nr:AcrR family transcriptional regulator [Saccharopolyspora gloriosae]
MSTTDKSGASMRDRLVETAVRLLVEEGPAVLQARRLAREVDASTMAVYHHFGGMPQLLAAVVDEGFRRLDGRLAAVPITDDPITDLGGLALAYRAAARDNPHLYDLMFGLPASGGSAGESEVAERAYGHLVAAADRAVGAGRIREQEPARAAAQLWSMLHGYVTLELSGHFDRFDDLEQVFIPMAVNLIVGLGDASDRAARSWSRIQH